MPDAATKYALASPNIVHEMFEDEVVIVNLDSGSYYSLEGSATRCWDLALTGFSVDGVVDSLCTEYQVARAIVETSVERFLSEVCREGLLIADTDSDSDPQAPDRARKPHIPIAAEASNSAFPPPVVNKYDEMRQLLLIDPVHMVGDAGWPQLPTDSAGSDDG